MSNSRQQRGDAKANKAITMFKVSKDNVSNFSVPRHHELTSIPVNEL